MVVVDASKEHVSYQKEATIRVNHAMHAVTTWRNICHAFTECDHQEAVKGNDYIQILLTSLKVRHMESFQQKVTQPHYKCSSLCNRNVIVVLKCMANKKFIVLQLHDRYLDSQCI